MANGTTKACNLTEDEIKTLINHHGFSIGDENRDERIERLTYLNRRLKAFNEPEKAEAQPEAEAATLTDAPKAAAGW